MKKYLISLLACIAIAFIIPGICIAKSDGNKLVPFKGSAMSGEIVNLGEIMQKQPVLLFFWASW